MNYLGIDKLITDALAEDLGTGDITTDSCIPADAWSEGHFVAKMDGVFCGVEILRRVFALVSDGDPVKKGQKIARISGPSRSVLYGERVALNLVQHMSGVATATRRAVEAVAGTGAVIVDTRKMTPGLRVLEKYAVKAGGGRNHRFNLADGVLIKDNHIVAAGGIPQAIGAVRNNAPHTLRVEIETETIGQVRQALEAGADIIMLDNMSVEEMRTCVIWRSASGSLRAAPSRRPAATWASGICGPWRRRASIISPSAP